MQTRTVSAILVWLAITFLIINAYLKSSWVFIACVGIVISAVVIYFLPRRVK